jgi:hypothetical protein
MLQRTSNSGGHRQAGGIGLPSKKIGGYRQGSVADQICVDAGKPFSPETRPHRDTAGSGLSARVREVTWYFPLKETAEREGRLDELHLNLQIPFNLELQDRGFKSRLELQMPHPASSYLARQSRLRPTVCLCQPDPEPPESDEIIVRRV